MRALVWNGIHDVRVERVPDPEIINPRDAIVKITSTAICGSDLHLYDGYIPTLKSGDILGHEFMGEIVALGKEVTNRKIGERVVVPFTIACGRCWYCEHDLFAACDNSNPNAWMVEKIYGSTSPAALYGYSHLYGGYAGGQAEYARVPYADVGPVPIPDGIPDEQVLFLSDIFPTGYMAAENCGISRGDVVAVWGCGPVGQFAIRSAFLLGAERVIAIDRFPERLQMARDGGAETLNYEDVDIPDALKEMTGGRGPDACLDAVGLEAHGNTIDAKVDHAQQIVRLATDRTHALREAIQCVRKGGTVSIPGVYGGFVDKFPMGAAFAKGITMKMGQTHMQRYLRPLLERVQRGEIDPSFVITHRLPLKNAPHGYRVFRDKEDNCVKVVLSP